ncbi:hypothetical protein ASE08_13685 [Rhizobacter sp. Root16D2]|nr:hypothetical protein ASC88_04700 [Rhizobacter sp. Root29]KQV98699.1 hypothetical protein ASC98_08530 [Rhizobacter sp. Root1238]KRB04953.1 hypothetical protein ASE08_13685 [Rhizobacter sp. Root16D2]
MQALINMPTPGVPSAATLQGTLNNAMVAGRNNWVTSYLTSDTGGAPVVANITGSNSLFASGYVARTIAGGLVRTYGEGTNWKQSPLISGFDIQAVANEVVWGAQMKKIVDDCTCKR